KLIFAQAFVSGSPSLGCQLMGKRVLHHGPFAPRGPTPLRRHLGAQLLLEVCVRADAQASAVPVRGGGALGAQSTRGTRSSRNLGMLAGDHGDGLAPRTGHLPTRKVQSEIMLGKKRPIWRPRACDHVPTV